MASPALLNLYGTPDAAASWTPADLSGLVAWYKADAGVTDAGGGAVSQWDDQSGNGYHLTQATGSKRPTTGATTINGLNVIDYTTAHTMAVASSMTDPYSILIVYKPTSLSSFKLVGGVNSGGNDYFGTLNSSWLFVSLSGGTPSSGTAYSVSFVRNGGTPNDLIVVDGTTVASGAAGNAGVNEFRIGGQDSGPSNGFQGSVCEAVFVDQAIGGTDATNWLSYSQSRWGTS